MQFRNRKIFFASVFFAVALVSIFGLNYVYRLREALTSSTDTYKNVITGLQSEINSAEEKVSQLEDENAYLKNLIVSQGVDVTNGASINYSLEVDPSTVSINNNAISPTPDSTNTLRFIITGHLYGSPEKHNTGTPSETLIRAVPLINHRDPQLFVALGDLTYAASDSSYQELYKNFLSRVNMAVLIAPGNHDFTNGREFYEQKYGQSFYYFSYAKNRFVVLDTEISNCYIVGRQEEMLTQAINTAIEDEDITNIFIFLHKVLFLEGNTLLRSRVNGICEYGTNYTEIYNSLLLPAAYKKPVYIIAGDVGAFGGNLSPFYNKHDKADLYTVAVGIGNAPEDALLQIDIKGAEVNFLIIPIGSKNLMPLENYSVQYWEKLP